MLVVWNVALLGSAAVNVAEVVFAKETLVAGDVGFGAFVAASGVGLALGSFLSAPALGKVGLRRHYVGSILLMGVGWGAAALSGSIWLAVRVRGGRRGRERRRPSSATGCSFSAARRITIAVVRSPRS